jgi:DNA-binding Lrp family transcriptional regulator
MKKDKNKEVLFVLVETEKGFLSSVMSALKELPSIKDVNAVTGQFDIIVKIEADSINEGLDIVLKQIREIDGIKNTQTLVSVKV